ncbi:MAG: MMPL family transporter, partial [Desulfobacterales bacterium]
AARGFPLDAYLAHVIRSPAWVLLCCAAITLFMAWQLPRLTFKTTVYEMVIEDTAESARYRQFLMRFGSDEIIRVVIRADNIFDAATFAKIQALSDEAAQIKGVRRVISLPVVKKAVDLSGNWDLAKFRDVIGHVDLFEKNLFSKNGKATVLTLVLTTDADPDAVIADVHHMIDQAPDTLSLYQIGMPLVSQALASLTQKDFFRLPPITFLLIAVVLLCIYRNFLHLMLPLLCVSFALIWDFGLMAVFDIKLSILTMIVPVFLIAVGTAYCLHIVAEYLLQAKQAETSKDAARATFMHVTFPTVLAVITTLIGLGSLLINRITAIQEFAIFACMGILSLLILAVTFFPAVMALIPLPTDLNPENALFVPAMETAVNFMMDGQPLIGERVLVLGQGIVGLLTTALLSRFPLTELVTFDRYAFRRQRSLEVGAHKALDPFIRGNIGDPNHILDDEALQGDADLVYELSGDPATLNQAVSFCGFGARIIVGSWYGTRRAALDLGRAFHRNRIRLISSQVSTIAPEMSGRWSKERRLAVVWDMIRNIRPDKLITHRFPVEKAQQAYDLLDRQPESAVQVVLTYGNSPM